MKTSRTVVVTDAAGGMGAEFIPAPHQQWRPCGGIETNEEALEKLAASVDRQHF